MANSFQEFITSLKEKLNIVDVSKNYLSMDRKGATYWACCPFHHEKTPSFSINEQGQFYHCFGCGASGDVIKFVCEMENIDFIDSVKILAERAKMELPDKGFDSERTAELKRKRDTYLKIANDAAHFYLDNLNSGNADEHIEYILQRKIPSNIVRTFGLGASLNFNDLPRYLLQKGYSRQDIVDSGMVNEAEGRLTDSQGGRLIFPIINQMNEVVGFGGRLLKKADFAKYKNTKETLIFNKSKTLYNINLLKKLRKAQTINEVIVVEGYMDTISLYQAGFKNVVASMGTSLTQEQARLLKRYTDNVLISYDGDFAGQKANMRGLEILKGEGLNVRVVPLPDGLDPDDVIKKFGTDGYQNCLDNALPLIDYKLGTVKKSFDLTKMEERRKYVTEAIKVIKTAESYSEKEELLKRLRDETGLTYESLKRDLDSIPEQLTIQKSKKPERKDSAPPTDKISRFVIAAFLFGEKYAQDDIMTIPFTSEVHRMIANYIYTKKLMEERVQPSELFELFDENTPEYTELTYILDYSNGDSLKGEVAYKYYCDCVTKLKLNELDSKIGEVTAKIDSESNIAIRTQLKEELKKLIINKEKIKSGASK